MKGLLLGAIRFYQRYVSPGLPPRCRFIPTCSQYALEAVEKYGPLRGGWLALRRFLRCHPFTRGICTILYPRQADQNCLYQKNRRNVQCLVPLANL